MHTHKPKFAKELALLSRKEKQKIFLLLKNKTLHTHNPADKSGMREQIDYYNGMSLDKKEGQLVTCGMFYCRDSAGFSVSAFNKLLCNLTGQCFEIGNKNIPPNRWAQLKRTSCN